MTSVKEGEKAPLFKAENQSGQQVSLSDYLGKKLVLYFYPQDDTPTCTVQACNLKDNFALLKSKGFSILGVSPDDVDSHSKFAGKFHLPFPLLADPEHTIINKYGVWGEKNLYGRKYEGLHRTTFLIDERGIIQKIFLKPRSRQHSEDIVKTWENLV
ncbi:MAG: thioredoxin-dependent thiol peroxidase [Chitinophagaceae bacterium]